MRESNLKRYENDLKALIKSGVKLYGHFDEKTKTSSSKEDDGKSNRVDFYLEYEGWYTEGLALIKQLIPNRIDDFTRLYKREKRKSIDYESYVISDYLMGLTVKRTRGVFIEDVVNPTRAAREKFLQQFTILKSAERVFQSSLFKIEQLLQADLFDSELVAAKEINEKGFARAAGALSGVVLERHFAKVAETHCVKVRKNDPCISDYNDLFKKNSIIDVPTWRFVQRLGDLRNLCTHNKKGEPTKEECRELIDGVDRIIKTVS